MKPLLIVLGWYRPGTGFTRVLEALVPLFARRYRVRWYGVGFRGDAFRTGDDVELLPTNPDGGDFLGAYALARSLPDLRPAAIFVLNDIWNLEHYARVLAPHRGRARLVGYFPLDGRPVDGRSVAPLVAYDALATFTRAARAAVGEAWPRASHRPSIRAVGHAVDIARFAPTRRLRSSGFEAGARLGERRRMFPTAAADPDPFWVLNASRLDPRKRLDLTLEGFAKFAADKPVGVRLCLHQALATREAADELYRRAAELGIAARLLASDESGPLPDADLNTLYNACDVGLNTAAGEGFGLVSFEHAAAGAAQIVPDHAALAELWGAHALRLPIVRRFVPPFSPLEMGETSADAVAAALERLYRDRALLRRQSRAACAHARAPRWRWGRVAAALDRLIAGAA